MKPAAVRVKIIVSVFLCSLIGVSALQAVSPVSGRIAWWVEARFGMFIHFGSYSYLGHGEWAFSTENRDKAGYQSTVTANFNPINFNATNIVTAARNAGMRYLVITAKHHEGFAMWDSRVPGFKDHSGRRLYTLPGMTGLKRDILMELKEQCDLQGVRFCLYYSILDWNHPSQIRENNYSRMTSMKARSAYIADMKAQLTELVRRYKPEVLWFDGDWTYHSGEPTLSKWWTRSDGIELAKYLISLDPDLVINERVVRGFGIGDFDCPEQWVPAVPQSRPWESCQTMNRSWGYNQWDNNYKTADAVLKELITVAARDGNYLLNIGPEADGTVPAKSLDTLAAIGRWMAVYSNSIRGTRGTPFAGRRNFQEPSWGRFTQRPGHLYAHIFAWPDDNKLRISRISNTITSIAFMDRQDMALKYQVSGGDIVVTLPSDLSRSNIPVIDIACDGGPIPVALPLKKAYTEMEMRKRGNTDLALNKGSTADSSQPDHPVGAGNDGNPDTRWCAIDEKLGHWYQVDLGKLSVITGTQVRWEFDDEYSYRIETSADGTDWKTKVQRKGFGQKDDDYFRASARYVRITVTGLNPGSWASLFDFMVFGE